MHRSSVMTPVMTKSSLLPGVATLLADTRSAGDDIDNMHVIARHEAPKQSQRIVVRLLRYARNDTGLASLLCSMVRLPTTPQKPPFLELIADFKVSKPRLTPIKQEARISPMSYEAERLALRLWLQRAASRWEAFRARLPTIPTRWLVLLCVGGLAAYAVLLRTLHLLNPQNYYVLSADSYFFHWLAGKIMAGETPPPWPGAEGTYTLHSGLAYPLAYIAKAFGSSPDALDLVCKLLPLLLGIVSMVVVYLAAARICDRRVALFSAFAWALMLYAVLVGAAGYLDRDGLSILLVMIGAFTFYLSRGWHLHIGKIDVGWLLAGLGVLGVEGLLYLEWSFVGPVLLLAILVLYFVVRFLLGYLEHMETERSAVRRLASAISEVNWRTFALIVLGNIVAASLYHQQATFLFDLGKAAVQTTGESAVAEMGGIGIGDILGYGFLLIPIAMGLYLAWKKRAEGSVFFACWFLCMLVLSLFARRVLLFATPAACLLSGVGLAFLWDWMKRGRFQELKKVGVAALLCLLVLLSFPMVSSMGSDPRVAVNEEWQDALAYMRESTPQDGAIMTQWGWGYWILDMGQRRPFVDGGFYGWDYWRNRDVGLAYSTTDPSEAAQMMEDRGAKYLVFSTLDLDFAPTILGWAGLGEEYDEFPEDSLVVRSLNGEFESGGGLEVIYRSAPDSEGFYPVVILHLAQVEQPSLNSD